MLDLSFELKIEFEFRILSIGFKFESKFGISMLN